MPDKTIINLADDQLTDSDRKRIREKILVNENTPSTRANSDLYQFFQEQLQELGNPYDVTRIPISVLEQMERDPMIAFGLHYSRVPIIRARWNIKCERADIAEFVDRSLRPILPSFIQQYTRCWNYGFSPIVKRFKLINPDWTYTDPSKSDEEIPVWNNGNVEAITWKPFIGLPCDPTMAEPRWTEGGDFNGIRYNGGALPLPFRALELNDQNKKLISVEHSLWATNEKTTVNESIWGYPRVGYAYRYWWSYWFKWALNDRFFERKADPPYVVYYPTGNEFAGDGEDNKESMKAIALGIGEAARGGGAIAMPSQTISGYDDRPTSIREWEIKELEVKGDMSNFVEIFEYLDVMKLRSLLVPEQAFLEGKGGTSSRNVASEEIDVHSGATQILSEEIDDHINRWMIPDLVAANFPDFDGECVKVTTGFTDADHSSMKDIIQLLGQTDAGALANLDIREILDRMGYPLVSMAEIKRQEEKIAEEMANAPAPAAAPVPGESAGTTEAGLYVAPGSRIELSDDAPFVANLPKSRHYNDKTVLSNARKLRARWNSSYKEIYEDFAEYVAKANLSETNLAEDNDAEKVAKAIIDKWNFSPKKIKALLTDSQDIMKTVIGRAGKVELKRIRTDADWSVDREDVAAFLEDRGAVYVKAASDTVKDELRPFLANKIREGKSTSEIASDIREHFADFPSWKADRLARTEIRDAYNFATLSAGEEAGIKVVQLIDAKLGEDRSDSECIDRNGEFVKIGDALSEALREHPNGTLEIRLTKRENLSINYLDDPKDDTTAYFDEENDTIYLSKELSDEDKLMYLDQIGRILENE